MGAETKIEWTDHTLNPWIGCSRVSPGCEHCYAETQANFRKSWGVTWGPLGNRRMTSEDTWHKPRVWNRAAEKAGVRHRVFCASLADVFEEGRWPELQNGRARLFDLIEKTPMLDWQLLTKRPQNIMGMVPSSWRGGFPNNVWAGCTVEDQKRANERIPELLKVPARVRFLSCEPLLEAVDLKAFIPWVFRNGIAPNADGTPFALPTVGGSRGVDWVIVGGESGGGARDFNLDWARAIVAQCKAANVACFVKQLGSVAITNNDDDRIHVGNMNLPRPFRLKLADRKGGDWQEWTEDLRVREWPVT